MADMCTQKGVECIRRASSQLYMSKERYKRCEAYWKKVENLPDFEALAKASQLLSNGGYWGPEAEDSIEPEDVNIEALKSQMRLFLQFYDKDVDPEKLTREDLKNLAERIVYKLQNPTDHVSSESMEGKLQCFFSVFLCLRKNGRGFCDGDRIYMRLLIHDGFGLRFDSLEDDRTSRFHSFMV